MKPLPNCGFAPIQRLLERLAFTDASSYAGAGYVVHFSDNIVHRMWTNEERLKSSTWLELKAVVLTLKGLSDHFQNNSSNCSQTIRMLLVYMRLVA